MYATSLASIVGINIMLAVSLNLITGLCGQVSLGHAAFFGAGAYAAALCATAGLPLPVALAAGAVVAGGLGTIVGFASIRLRTDFLAVTTIGVGFLLLGFVRKQRWLGAEMGLSRIPGSGLGADMAGGFIASCRNPVRASYIKQHAALGGISIALALGEAIIQAEPQGGDAVIAAICRETKGEIIGQGSVTKKAVRYTNEAFDIGTIQVGGVTLHVMNEYMAVNDAHGTRLAGWPDVITTLNRDGVPASVGEIREGDELLVLRIPKNVIPLSSSATDPSVFPFVEKALGINLSDYALSR